MAYLFCLLTIQLKLILINCKINFRKSSVYMNFFGAKRLSLIIIGISTIDSRNLEIQETL